MRSFAPQTMVITLKKPKFLPGIFLCTKIFASSKQFWLARKDTQHFFVTQVSSLVLKSRYLLLKIICIRRYPELYVLLFWWFNELIAKIICWNDGPYCTDYAGVCIKKLKNWSSIFFCLILQQLGQEGYQIKALSLNWNHSNHPFFEGKKIIFYTRHTLEQR